MVKVKAAENGPVTDADTVYVPALAFAIAPTVAMPDALVEAVALLSAAEAPVVGEAVAAKVTMAALTGLPLPSSTRAVRGNAKAAPVRAICPLPPVAVIVAGAPATFVRVALTLAVPLPPTGTPAEIV